MIRYRDKVYEDYSIDPVTAVITDKEGNIVSQHIKQGRLYFKGMPVHCIQAHTAWGFKQGYDVHHLDENKLNNALSNLQYLTRSRHMMIHRNNKGRDAWSKDRIFLAQLKADKLKKNTRYMVNTLLWDNGNETLSLRGCPGEGWRLVGMTVMTETDKCVEISATF